MTRTKTEAEGRKGLLREKLLRRVKRSSWMSDAGYASALDAERRTNSPHLRSSTPEDVQKPLSTVVLHAALGIALLLTALALLAGIGYLATQFTALDKYDFWHEARSGVAQVKPSGFLAFAEAGFWACLKGAFTVVAVAFCGCVVYLGGSWLLEVLCSLGEFVVCAYNTAMHKWSDLKQAD